LMMAATLILVVVGTVWSVVATAPVKVTAQGMLMGVGGVLNVTSENQGRIVTLLVKSGDRVLPGQVVAYIEQPDVRQDLESARAEMRELERQKKLIVDFQDRDMKTQVNLLDQKRRDLKQSTVYIQDRIKWLEEREKGEADLLAKQVIDRQRYANTRVDLNTAHEALAKANNDIKQIERDITAQTIGQEREILDKDMAIGAAVRKIESLEERLKRQSKVESPYSGNIVELKVNPGEIIDRSTALFSLVPTGGSSVEESARDLISVLYVAPTDGKKIRPGMVVQIAPSTVKREEYGFILGKVRQVAEVPSTMEGMMRTLKNQQLVTTLSGGGAPFEVIVDLDRDTATPSGFRWSSSRGPDTRINSGTLADATITVRRVHLISLIIPALEPMLDR
ncbi:MAG: NHLP bacteriocin system secretion protein, partial [Alphaproteobacteria bacterium]|nr:NHLP bacteriocin system secretion protein [Alphaproteobacteria bacterium]